MTQLTEAWEVIDKLTAALAQLAEASKLLWDVRIIMESPEFKDEVFWEFKEIETGLYDHIEKVKDFKGRMTV